MGFLRRHRASLVVGVAVVAPFVVAASLVPLRGVFANTAMAIVMVLLITVIAILGTRVAGIVASASCVIWFDIFWTVPYDRLTINHRPDLETTIAILVVGVIITELAQRSRHHWQAASDATRYVAMLHDLADLVASSAETDAIIDATNSSLVELLGLRDCAFDPTLADPPLARIEANGEVVHVGMRWPAREIGIPGPQAEIVAQWRGRVIGRFVVTPTPGFPVSQERRVVAVSLVDVVAAGLQGRRRVG